MVKISVGVTRVSLARLRPNTTKCLINPKRPPIVGQSMGTSTKKGNTSNHLINPKRTPPGATQGGPVVRGVCVHRTVKPVLVVQIHVLMVKISVGVTRVSLARLRPNTTKCLINPKRPPIVGQSMGTSTKKGNTSNHLINPKRTPPGATQGGPVVRSICMHRTVKPVLVVQTHVLMVKISVGVTRVSLARLRPNTTKCLINPKRPPIVGQSMGTSTKKGKTSNHLIDPKRTPPGATQGGPVVRSVCVHRTVKPVLVVQTHVLMVKISVGVTRVSLAHLRPDTSMYPMGRTTIQRATYN